MSRLSIFVALLLVVGASAAPTCVDGKDNVIDIEDVSGGKYDIHFQNVIGQTYDQNNATACHGADAALCLPGLLKLVSGTITVTKANDLASSGDIRVTLKKNSVLIGTVCQDGKAKNPAVTDDDCHGSIESILGPDFTKLLSTPGTYNLAQVEQMGGFGNNLLLPGVSAAINTILKGEWQVTATLVSNGNTIAAIKVPSNKPWLYIN